MTRIFEDGFETGDMSQWSPGQITAGETATVVSISPFKGIYHADFECDGLPGTAGEMSFVQLVLAAPGLYDCYTRQYIKIIKALPAVGKGFLASPNLRTALASGYGFAYVQVYNDAASGPIFRLYWVDQAGSHWTAITIPVALDTWYCIEVHVKVDSVNGSYEFWVDGQPAIIITGVDNLTPRATSPFLGGPVNFIQIGERWSDVGNPAHGIYIDNFVLANTYIGVEPLPPQPPQLCPAAVIATAVYGPSIELNILRGFRDSFMARNNFGCWLSRAYYNVGKYIAKWLTNKEYVKTIMKGYLFTVIKIVKRL